MNDAFERRALLLHLGRTLQLLARILETHATAETIGELIELNPILENEVLLRHVSPSMSVEEFVMRTQQAFCGWPQALLDETLDHDAFAASVRNRLFALNARGWHAYAAGLRSEVAWFGLESPRASRPRARRRSDDRVAARSPARANVAGAGAAAASPRDIERDQDDPERTSENIEGLSPPRGATRLNEQSLPDFE
ncbi:hypothetical protein VSR34_10290 [Paraburkholderia sp. JHI2823]|uniref:hypothetical protein n=1 Tax=Paraburkholderia sp. JHI2823 TaxID=3112960 RepID=UPI00317A8F43